MNQEVLQEIEIEGKRYIATSVLAELTGYDSDHIGRLAREGKVENIKREKRWYVLKESLDNYKKQVEETRSILASQSNKVPRRPIAPSKHFRIAEAGQTRAPIPNIGIRGRAIRS